MTAYVELRRGIINNRTERSTVIPLEDLYKSIDPYKDCYRSLFYYDEAILAHITKNNTISGFRGKVGVDRLVFDFDHQDLEIARKDALSLIDKLKSTYDVQSNEIGIFFSGRKGFAIEIKTEGLVALDKQFDDNIPYLVKRVCLNLANGLQSADRVIYNHNRLYRIAGTLHQGTSSVNGVEMQLFKTSLSEDMLRNLSIDEIKSYSVSLKAPFLFDVLSNPAKLNKLIDEAKENITKVVRELPSSISTDTNGLPDDNLAPRGQKICYWRLQQGTVTDSRNNALLRIAVQDKNLNLPKEVIFGKLMGVLALMKANNPEKDKLDPITEVDVQRIVDQAFNNPYDFGCMDPILSSVCSRKCYLAPKVFPDQASSLSTFADVYKKSSAFYKKYFENIVPTGFQCIDTNMPMFLGTFSLIVGKPGSGKSSVMLNIMKHCSDNGIPALYFNIDMTEELLTQRCGAILLRDEKGHPRFSGKEFMEAHARGNLKLMKEAEEVFDKLSDNVLISSKSTLTVEDIKREIEIQENIWQKKAKLVIIDYVQLLKSHHEGLYANSTFNAEALKNLAKDKNICIIGLSQPSNRGQKSDQELGLEAAKGSGAWEENVSSQLACWRPFRLTRPEQDWVMTVKVAKNRLGSEDKVDLFWHGPSGFVRDLNEAEQMQLVALREQIEDEEQ